MGGQSYLQTCKLRKVSKELENSQKCQEHSQKTKETFTFDFYAKVWVAEIFPCGNFAILETFRRQIPSYLFHDNLGRLRNNASCGKIPQNGRFPTRAAILKTCRLVAARRTARKFKILLCRPRVIEDFRSRIKYLSYYFLSSLCVCK